MVGRREDCHGKAISISLADYIGVETIQLAEGNAVSTLARARVVDMEKISTRLNAVQTNHQDDRSVQLKSQCELLPCCTKVVADSIVRRIYNDMAQYTRMV